MENPQPAAPTPPVPEAREARGSRPSVKRNSRFGLRPPRACPFCTQKMNYIDYRQVDLLRRFVTDRGKIKARRKIGTCAKHQRRLAVAIKRARHIALLPFVAETIRGE